MMITGIGASQQIQGIYIYGDSRHVQSTDAAVAPVSKISPVAKLDEDEDKLKTAVTYRQDEERQVNDDAVSLKEKDSLAESYKDQDVVQYNMNNPYELARMSIENSLLAGMHFNMLA